MKKLYRSRTDRKLGGVCGGLGQYLSVDPTLLRLAAVFVCVATGFLPVAVTYIVAWIIIPEAPPGGVHEYQQPPEPG